MPRWTKQANGWSCYPTAISILTGIPVEGLVQAMGHDGSAVCDPEKGDPWGREAFIHAELVLALAEYDWVLGHIYAAVPRLAYPSFEEIKDRICRWGCPTVVTVQKPNGMHAYAWDVSGDRLIDPLIGEEVNENPYPVIAFEPLFRIIRTEICDGYSPVTLPHYRRAPNNTDVI